MASKILDITNVAVAGMKANRQAGIKRKSKEFPDHMATLGLDLFMWYMRPFKPYAVRYALEKMSIGEQIDYRITEDKIGLCIK